MLERAVRDKLQIPPDPEETGRVVGVDDEQAHLWVGEQVAALPAFEGRVDAGALDLGLMPDGTWPEHAARLVTSRIALADAMRDEFDALRMPTSPALTGALEAASVRSSWPAVSPNSPVG
jgi:hypothetical protein